MIPSDLFELFTGHPTSCEGLDGDGSQADHLVDLFHAVASPVSLDHNCCPALLQCCSTHCFTAGLTNNVSCCKCQNHNTFY